MRSTKAGAAASTASSSPRGGLNHPNIVTIYDVGTEGDIAYLATEYLDGRTLRDLLDAGVTLLPARAADIAAQVADGLAFIHQRGIVHRDIKPDNLMLLRGGGVKITDFGIARLSRGAHTQIAEVVASPRYTSPEQVTGEGIDERSDLFSLGAVLHEMLSGTPPFVGGRLHEIAHQIVNEMPPAPSTRNRNVSSALDAVVAKALAKRPGDRYRDAREMATALRMVTQAAPRGSDEAPADVASLSVPVEAIAAAPAAEDDVRPGEASSGEASPAGKHRRRGRAWAPYVVPALVLLGAAGWLWLAPGTPGWIWLAPATPGTAPPGARMDTPAGGEVATAPAAVAPAKTEASPPTAGTPRGIERFAGGDPRSQGRSHPRCDEHGSTRAGHQPVGRGLRRRSENGRVAADDGTQAATGNVHDRNPQLRRSRPTAKASTFAAPPTRN